MGKSNAVASLVKANVPLPKYFHAEASHMQYSLPPLRRDSSHASPLSRERASQLLGEKFHLTWIPVGNAEGKEMESQLVVITQHGEWYRLTLSNGEEVSQAGDGTSKGVCRVIEHRKLWRMDHTDE
jgi:hypothetical protein